MIAGAATSNRDAFELEEGNDERCADGEPSLGSISAYEYSDQPKWLAGVATIRLIRLLFTMIALEPAQWIAELAMWLGNRSPPVHAGGPCSRFFECCGNKHRGNRR